MSAWTEWKPPELSELTKRVLCGTAIAIGMTWFFYWFIPWLTQPVVMHVTVTPILP